MRLLVPVYLVFLGAILLFYSFFLKEVAITSSVSDARQFEAEIKKWVDEKKKEGKLTEEDVFELFPMDYSLAFAGENPNQNFRAMIEDISGRYRLPNWIGFLSLSIGVLGLFRINRKQNKSRAQIASSEAVPDSSAMR